MANDGWVTIEKSNTTTWDYKKDPDFVGIYKGVEHNVGPNNNTIFKFYTDQGEFGVWGSSALTDKLLGVPVGYEVKIHYEGMKKSIKSGRSYHDFLVQHRAIFTEGEK